jgi:hypothetical protein
MKKQSLKNLALFGLIAGSLISIPSNANAAPGGQNSQGTTQNSSTDATKKAKDSNKKDSQDDSSKKDKKQEPKSQPSAAGEEDCGAFCAAADASQLQSTKSNDLLKLKRLKQI